MVAWSLAIGFLKRQVGAVHHLFASFNKDAVLGLVLIDGNLGLRLLINECALGLLLSRLNSGHGALLILIGHVTDNLLVRQACRIKDELSEVVVENFLALCFQLLR